MTPVRDEAVASFLEARALRPAWTGVPEVHRPGSIRAGYRLQAAVHDRLEAGGDRRVGYKIGSTSAAGQRGFGLNEPIYAGMFESGRAASLSAALALPLAAPMVECEIAVVLKQGIASDTQDPARILEAIGSCHIACEVVDNRYGDPLAVGVPTLIADDFFHAAFVLGPASPDWATLAFGRLGAEVRVDGERFHGNASDVLSAIDAVGWLVQKLAQTGRRLQAGDILLTGAIVPPVPVKATPRELLLSIEGFSPLRLDGSA